MVRKEIMPEKDMNYHKFTWPDLGDLEEGRPNLGLSVPVLVYRLLAYTLKDVMTGELGPGKTDEIFVKAGRLAGVEFCRNALDKRLAFNKFVAELQRKLKDMSIGILRIEKADTDQMKFILTVAEDLDCSGLPFTNEVVCKYDEGFIAGIMETYTGKPFVAEEIDCWASGGRVCRFDVREVKTDK